MDELHKKAFVTLIQYWQNQEKKLEADAKEMIENFQRDIEKQEKLQKKIKMMREHPEWFETTSPKQYGMNLNKRKYGRY